jgi:hypothetical protein
MMAKERNASMSVAIPLALNSPMMTNPRLKVRCEFSICDGAVKGYMVNARVHFARVGPHHTKTWAAQPPKRGGPIFYPAAPMLKRMFFLPVSGGDWIELIGDYTVAKAQLIAERQAGEPCQFGGSLFIAGAHPTPRAIPVPPRRRRPSRLLFLAEDGR